MVGSNSAICKCCRILIGWLRALAPDWSVGLNGLIEVFQQGEHHSFPIPGVVRSSLRLKNILSEISSVEMSSSPVTNLNHFPPLPLRNMNSMSSMSMQFPVSSKPVSRVYTIDQILGNTEKHQEEQPAVFVKSEFSLQSHAIV